MLKRMLAAGLVVGLAAVVLASCGGNEAAAPASVGKAALYTFIGDTPASDVLSMRISVTSMTLTQQGTTNEVDLPVSGSASSARLDFASLRDFTTVLSVASMPEVTYDKITLNFSFPQIVLYDPTQSPPVRVVNAAMAKATAVVPIRPALAVVKDEVAALRLDFDLLRSIAIEVDTDGHVSGTLTPVMKAAPIVPVEGQGFGEFDGLVGFVRTVAPYPGTENFTGAFTLQLLAGDGPAISVNFTNSTQLFGVPALNQLETGRVVEVEAVIDEKGNFVAKTVEVGDRAVVDENKLAFLGYVTSVTKDQSGKLSQFSLYVREEQPDVSYQVPLDSVVIVHVSSTTTFQHSSRSTNFASLPFDGTAVTPGQELIVHGKYTTAQDMPTTVDANLIVLKLQTVQGNLASLVQVSPDGRTGAFWFAPSLTLLQSAPVMVMTNSETVFVGVLGLGDLTSQSFLLVKGLPFYQMQAGTINGVAVPAGTLVITARQVHQLQ